MSNTEDPIAEQYKIEQEAINQRISALNLLRRRVRLQRNLDCDGNLFERDSQFYTSIDRERYLQIPEDDLVIGRLDTSNGSHFYIGAVGLSDNQTDGTEKFLVDWRADTAAPFYTATAASPGTVERRRTFTSQSGKLTDINDDVYVKNEEKYAHVLGEGSLMASLRRSRSKQMNTIVGTLQEDQHAIIQAPLDESQLITGNAGTGKTVVALHRLANVLYQSRLRKNSYKCLVFGPSMRFLTYIGKVLPSLGENAVTYLSYEDVGRLQHLNPEHRRVSWAVALGGKSILPILQEALVKTLVARARRAGGLSPTHILLSDVAPLLAPVLKKHLGKLRSSRQAIFEATCAAAGEDPDFLYQDRNSAAREVGYWVDEWLTEPCLSEIWLDITNAASFHSYLASHGLDTEIKRYWASGRVTVDDVALISEIEHLMGPTKPAFWDEDEDDQEDDLLSEVTSTEDRIIARRIPGGRASAPFDLIAVDESQDMTFMQWRWLQRHSKATTKWIVVGDSNQAQFADANFPEVFERSIPDARRYLLKNNYRTPRRIGNFADTTCNIDAPGKYIRDEEDCLTIEEVPTESLPDRLDQWVASVSDKPGSKVIIRPNTKRHSETKGCETLSSTEAKGLEWDHVLVVDPEAIRHVEGSSGLYVALTRATSSMTVLSTDESVQA